MRRQHLVAGALVSVACGLVIGTLLHPTSVLGQRVLSKRVSGPGTVQRVPSKRASGPRTVQRVPSKRAPRPIQVLLLPPPLPPPVMGPDTVPLSNVQKLGKLLIYDNTLSNPPGYACATCHIPSTGHTGPLSSVNASSGPMPGVVPGRVGRRKPQTYNYATLSPTGPFFDAQFAAAWVGGNFWDGRAADSAAQALDPLVDPNEMANINRGSSAHPFNPLVVQKIRKRPYANRFKQEWGPDVFRKYTPQQLYILVGAAMAAFEASGEVNSFNSKYDASPFGVPPKNQYTLTASEERGRQLFFGNALCFQCHSSTGSPPIQATTAGKDTFTMYCFANIGIPRNPQNPFYQETNCVANPLGCNALGTDFIDVGLGSNPNPAPDANRTRFFNTTVGDIPQFNGLFKTPTVRDVDKRPTPDFVKAYMHNGVFKSLKQVVHFYNTRNLTTSDLPLTGNPSTNPIDLTNPTTYVTSLAGRTPLWGPPEVLDRTSRLVDTYMGYLTLNNPTGLPPGMGGQVGNLGLTDQQENDIVAFLQSLTGGFTSPNPISP